jgi:hypothetical protein
LFTLMTNVARSDTHSSKCMIHEKASNLPKKKHKEKNIEKIDALHGTE